MGIQLFYKEEIYKKILGFNKDAVQISFSTRTLTNSVGNVNNYITYNALGAINNVIKILTLVNYKFNLIEKESESKNEINIGGFLTNKKVNSYFTKYFPKFKYFVDVKYKQIYSQYQIDDRIIEYSSNKIGFQIGDRFLEINNKVSDYAFLIKLVRSDFKDNNDQIVHILFGGSDMATLKASDYFLNYNKQIYNRYKNNHYFFAIGINRIDKSIDYSKGIIDLTDIMFNVSR